MDEEQFERLLEEFRGMREDQHLDMGRRGLAQMRFEMEERRRMDARGRTDSPYDRHEYREPQITTSYMDSIVSDLKANVYTVRLQDPIRTLINPLGARMEELHIGDRLQADQHHHEQVVMSSMLIRSINEMKAAFRPTFMDGLSFQYRMFMRHPIWNTMRLMNRYLIAPVFRAASGILFGFKEEMSVDEKILEAIKEQTQFLMKGEIEPSRGFFQRLMRGGLVGLAGRGALTAVGAGRGTAQRREDQRARGESVTGGLRGALADMFSRQDITRRGRHGFGHTPEPEQDPVASAVEKSMEAVRAEIQLLRDGVDWSGIRDRASEKITSLMDEVSDMGSQVREGIRNASDQSQDKQASSTERLIDRITGALRHTSKESIRSQERGFLRTLQRPIVSIMGAQTRELRAANDELRGDFVQAVNGIAEQQGDYNFRAMTHWQNEREQGSILQDQNETIKDTLDDIRGFTRASARELRRARFTQFMNFMANITRGVLGTAMDVINSISGVLRTAIQSIVGVGGVAAGAVSMIRRFRNRGGSAGTKPAGQPGRSSPGGGARMAMRGVAPLAIGASALEAWRISRNTEGEERTRELSGLAGGTAGALGGAKMGAIAGSALGPVGTLAGGAIGGALGYFGGQGVGKAASDFFHETQEFFQGLLDKSSAITSFFQNFWEQLEKFTPAGMARAARDKIGSFFGRGSDDDDPVVEQEAVTAQPRTIRSIVDPSSSVVERNVNHTQDVPTVVPATNIMETLQQRGDVSENEEYVREQRQAHQQELNELSGINAVLKEILKTTKSQQGSSDDPAPDNSQMLDRLLQGVRGY